MPTYFAHGGPWRRPGRHVSVNIGHSVGRRTAVTHLDDVFYGCLWQLFLWFSARFWFWRDYPFLGSCKNVSAWGGGVENRRDDARVAQRVDEEEEGAAGAAVEELMFGGRDNGGKGLGGGWLYTAPSKKVMMRRWMGVN